MLEEPIEPGATVVRLPRSGRRPEGAGAPVGRTPSGLSFRDPVAHLAVLLAAAIALGGGGVGAAFFNLPVQLLALAVLAFNSGAVAALAKPHRRGLLVLVALTLALPLVQIMPLPAPIWQALPGRELGLRALDLIGRGEGAFPFSLDRNRTLLAFIGLIPPFAVLVLSLRLEGEGRARIFRMIVAMGLLNVLLGGLQLASAQTTFSWYPGAVTNHLYGTFANHNAAGLFLVLALCALLALPGEGLRSGSLSLAVRVAVGAVLVLATVLTQSRSSIALLLLPLFLAAVRWLRRRAARSISRAQLAGGVAVAIMLLGGTGILLASNAKVGQTLERFQLQDDIRPRVWSDTLESIGRFWPLGSGMGTFDEVFQVDESLEYIDPKRAGRAHNEYLEIALEAGVVGLTLVAGWFAFCLLRWWRARSCPKAPEINAMAIGLSCVALQAVVDYPLRNEALLCVTAFMLGVLATKQGRNEEGNG